MNLSDREMTEAEAYEYEMSYYKSRLEDPSLLDGALQVEGLLAVPVGGKRRGGYVQFEDEETCRRAIDRLAGREGFANLRYDHQVDDDGVEYHLVRWGDPALLVADVPAAVVAFETEEGRYYGYRKAAIQRYLRERV